MVVGAVAVGAIAAGLGALSARKRRKAARKARRIEQERQARLRGLAREELTETETEIERQFPFQKRSVAEAAQRRGLFKSSIRQEADKNLDIARQLRLEAIRRSRERLDIGEQAQNALDRLKAATQRSLDNLALVQSFVQGGLVGAVTAGVGQGRTPSSTEPVTPNPGPFTTSGLA